MTNTFRFWVPKAFDWKKEPKIRMAATRRNLFPKSKMKTNRSLTNHGRRQSDGNFFFRKNRFFFDKKSYFVQKIDKNGKWKSRNQYFILTSFIESKIKNWRKKNKMAEKIKMAAKHKFSIAKSI
jgi:hypothetical protein